MKLWYPELWIPADTVLDLNGHTLNAALFAADDSTVKNGTLLGAVVCESDYTEGTLTLEHVKADLKSVMLEDFSVLLMWNGALVLKDSTVNVEEGMSLWYPPESGAMLTMDATSSLTMAQFDLSKVSTKNTGFVLLTYNGTAADTKDTVSAYYQNTLGKFLPDGLAIEAAFIGAEESEGIYAYIISVVKTADGSYPESISLKAPTCAVVVMNGTGSGNYAEGATVRISANAPAAGKQFNGWIFSPAVYNISPDTKTISVSFTMPSHDVTATATYKDVTTPTPTTGGSSDDDSGYDDDRGGDSSSSGSNTPGGNGNSVDNGGAVTNADGSKTESTATTAVTIKENEDGSTTETTKATETTVTTAATRRRTEFSLRSACRRAARASLRRKKTRTAI